MKSRRLGLSARRRLASTIRSEAGAAGEAEGLRHVVLRLRCHDRVVKTDRTEWRGPEDRGADRRAYLFLVVQNDTAALPKVRRGIWRQAGETRNAEHLLAEARAAAIIPDDPGIG